VFNVVTDDFSPSVPRIDKLPFFIARAKTPTVGTTPRDGDCVESYLPWEARKRFGFEPCRLRGLCIT